MLLFFSFLLGPPILVVVGIWILYDWSKRTPPVINNQLAAPYKSPYSRELFSGHNNLFNQAELNFMNKNSDDYKNRLFRKHLGQGAKSLHAHGVELNNKCKLAFERWEKKHRQSGAKGPNPNWTWSYEIIQLRIAVLSAVMKKNCSKNFIKELDLKKELRHLRHRTAGYLWACRTNKEPNYDPAIVFVNFKPSLASRMGGGRAPIFPQTYSKPSAPFVPTPVKTPFELRRDKLLANRAKPSVAAVKVPVSAKV